MHILAEMTSDQDKTPGITDIKRLGAVKRFSEGCLEGHFARTAALCVGWRCNMWRTEGTKKG